MKKQKILLVCEECLNRNYSVKKSAGHEGRLIIKKFCKNCNKHTVHKDSK